MRLIQTPFALVFSLTAAAASAHPGHGARVDTLLHWLGEPVHALPIMAALVGVVAVGATRQLRRSRKR